METFVGLFQLLKSVTTRAQEGTTDVAEETLDNSAIEVGRETPMLSTPVVKVGRETPISTKDVGSGTPSLRLKHNSNSDDNGIRTEIDEILAAFKKNDVAWMEAKLEDLKKQGTSRTKEVAGPNEKKDHSEFIFAEPEYEWMDEFAETSRPACIPRSSIRRLGESNFKEHGLRPMNPDYYKMAYDIGNDEQRTELCRNHKGTRKSSKKRKARSDVQSAAFTF
ncbi:hypothetical protein ANCCAN_01466 [Ancylostoma caninum]|uniref:Uncharacterized protein n=1 Tax=Ancylostoma caninum TaxID=29170 RepID=A0A368H726_ANCCA|nr:hypothetical protein ANCCAN_01466 [Ancylostoma caninum]